MPHLSILAFEKKNLDLDAMGVGRTFIQLTYDRFSEFIPKENFFVLTGEIYKSLVTNNTPRLTTEQVLTEPCRRNTAPCIAYAMQASSVTCSVLYL